MYLGDTHTWNMKSYFLCNIPKDRLLLDFLQIPPSILTLLNIKKSKKHNCEWPAPPGFSALYQAFRDTKY